MAHSWAMFHTRPPIISTLVACLFLTALGPRDASACVKGLHCHTVAGSAQFLARAEWLLLNRRYAEAGAEVLKHWPSLQWRKTEKLFRAGGLVRQAAQILAVATLRQRGRAFAVMNQRVRVNRRWARNALKALGGLRPGHAGAAFVGGVYARRPTKGKGRHRNLDQLRRLLSDKNPARRQRAASTVDEKASYALAASPYLVERVRSDPDPGVRVAAARALARIHNRDASTWKGQRLGGHNHCTPRQAGCQVPPGSVVQALLGLLGHEVVMVRYAALKALGQLAPWRATRTSSLERLLRDPSPLVRIAAVNSIGALGRAGAPSIPALFKLLDGKDPELKEVAAYALAKLLPLPDASLQRMVGYLKAGPYRAPYSDRRCGSQEPLKKLAARALAIMGRRAAPAAQALADNLSGAVGDDVRMALRRIGPRAIPALRRVLAGTDVHAKRSALAVLAYIGKRHAAAIPFVFSAFNDSDSFVRNDAVQVLVHVCGKVAVPALCKGLRSKKAVVRLYSAEALAGLKRSSAPCAEQLAKLFMDAANTRHQAARALTAIGPAVVPLMTRTLSHRRGAVREAAAKVLATFGSQAKPALGMLIKLLSDPTTKVRAAAAWALGQVGRAARPAVPGLVRAVRSKERARYMWRRESIDALGRIGVASPEVLSTLVAVAGEPGCRKRTYISGDPRMAVVALGRLGKATPEVTHTLRKMLRSKRIDCRVCAARALAQHGHKDPSVIRVLLRGLPERTNREMTETERIRVRLVAAEGVAHVGEGARRAALLLGRMLEEQWRDDQHELREAAARALVALRRHGVRPLARALNASSSEVRLAAAAALGRVGARIGAAAAVALPLVARAMTDNWYQTNELVLYLRLVRAVGPRAAKAARLIKLVQKAASDKRQVVRRSATSALQKIGAPR